VYFRGTSCDTETVPTWRRQTRERPVGRSLTMRRPRRKLRRLLICLLSLPIRLLVLGLAHCGRFRLREHMREELRDPLIAAVNSQDPAAELRREAPRTARRDDDAVLLAVRVGEGRRRLAPERRDRRPLLRRECAGHLLRDWLQEGR